METMVVLFLRISRIYLLMITFKLFQTQIQLDFSFFAVLSVFFFFNSEMGISAFMSCLFHEFGHLIFMCISDVRIERLLFYGGGIRITADVENAAFTSRLLILLAGCIFNLILAGVFLALHCETIAAVNVMTAVLNLLPFGYLDGSRAAQSVLYRYFHPRKAEQLLRVLRWTAAIFAVLLIVAIKAVPDVTLIVFAVYLVILQREYFRSM